VLPSWHPQAHCTPCTQSQSPVSQLLGNLKPANCAAVLLTEACTTLLVLWTVLQDKRIELPCFHSLPLVLAAKLDKPVMACVCPSHITHWVLAALTSSMYWPILVRLAMLAKICCAACYLPPISPDCDPRLAAAKECMKPNPTLRGRICSCLRIMRPLAGCRSSGGGLTCTKPRGGRPRCHTWRASSCPLATSARPLTRVPLRVRPKPSWSAQSHTGRYSKTRCARGQVGKELRPRQDLHMGGQV